MAQNKFNEETLNEFKEAFNNFDLDGRGKLTKGELGPFFSALQFTKTEVNELLEEADTDELGNVELPEILMLLARKMKDSDTGEKVKSAFKTYDKHSIGAISIEDLGKVMVNLGDKLSDDEIA